VADLFPGGDSAPAQFVLLDGGRALFVAEGTGTGRELWVTDGTATGTTLVKDIRPLELGSSLRLRDAGVLNGFAYFIADDGANGTELWRSDGTPAGTTLVKDFTGDSRNGVTTEPFVALGSLFVSGFHDAGNVLWRSDG